VLNLFRLDLTAGHFILLGICRGRWGIDDFRRRHRISGAGQAGAQHHAVARLSADRAGRAGGTLIWVSWKYGRIYCGWLCPHFSVVETINQTMRRAIGRQSVWEKQPQPARNPDGTVTERDAIWWLAVLPLAVGFAFLWVISVHELCLAAAADLAQPVPRRAAAFPADHPYRRQYCAVSMEFLFARHLFCRFACAAGLFQSLAWMGNRKAMVVGFERGRAPECAGCESECDQRLPDAAEAAQRQAHDVQLRAVRAVPECLRPCAPRMPIPTGRCCTGCTKTAPGTRPPSTRGRRSRASATASR
jgi:ferredoxin-type protein NapH